MTWIGTSTSPSSHVRSNDRPERGLLDTSVIIDLEQIPDNSLPTRSAISAITLAELAAGPHATEDPRLRSRRQDCLQRAEAGFDPILFNADAARAYGRIYAAVSRAGRKPRGARAVDLLIAATALAEGIPLYTRNPADFGALDDLIQVIAV